VVALRNGWELFPAVFFFASNDKREAAASVMIAEITFTAGIPLSRESKLRSFG
jgi:hypothetical protein